MDAASQGSAFPLSTFPPCTVKLPRFISFAARKLKRNDIFRNPDPSHAFKGVNTINVMKIPTHIRPLLTLVCSACVMLPIEAMARTHSHVVVGNRGTATREVSRHGSDLRRSTTVTGSNGKTWSHAYDRDANRAAGTLDVSSSTTRPDGSSASRTLQRQRTDGSRTVTGQATGFNGKTATLNSETVKTETGFDRETTVVGTQGNTKETHVVVAKDGHTTTRTTTRTKTPTP